MEIKLICNRCGKRIETFRGRYVVVGRNNYYCDWCKSTVIDTIYNTKFKPTPLEVRSKIGCLYKCHIGKKTIKNALKVMDKYSPLDNNIKYETVSDFLYIEYVEKEKSSKQLSKILRINQQTILTTLRKLCIMRNQGGYNNQINNTGVFSKFYKKTGAFRNYTAEKIKIVKTDNSKNKFKDIICNQCKEYISKDKWVLSKDVRELMCKHDCGKSIRFGVGRGYQNLKTEDRKLIRQKQLYKIEQKKIIEKEMEDFKLELLKLRGVK